MVKVEKNSAVVFLKNIVRSKWFYYCLVLVVVNILTAKWAVTKNDSSGMKFIVPVQLAVELGLAVAYYLVKKKKMPVEKVFLLLVIPFGLLFIALLPCGQTPDEAAHYMRTYGITKGELIVPQTETNNGGSELPSALSEVFYSSIRKGIYGEIAEDMSFGTDGDVREYNYAPAALYNPIVYLPQTMGVLLGKLFHAPLVIGVYLGRLFDFVVFVLLIYYAIKYAPKFKNFILFMALFPVTLQEATSLSPDALTIGLSVFLISFVCYLAYGKKGKMNRKELSVLYVLAIIIGFCKIVYLPLLLLYFLIPTERFGGVKQRRLHAAIMCGIVFLLNAGWLLISSRYLVAVRAGVNPGEQVKYMMSHPHYFLTSLLATMSARLDYWSSTMFGMSLGHYEIYLPQIYYYLYLVIFLLLLVQNSERFVIKKSDKWIIISVCIIVYCLIATSLYIQWTPVGDYYIDGIQGRYFLPILLLLPLAFCPTKEAKKPKPSFNIVKQELIVYSGIFCNVAALTCIFVANF